VAAFKTLALLGTICEMHRQNKNGEDAVQTRIAGAIDLTHSSRANRRDDLVRAKLIA